MPKLSRLWRGRKHVDRISNLPDDIIYHILSFLDMKYAVQTCILSKRWKPIWISVRELNLDIEMFTTPYAFTKFVNHVLSHRDNSLEVSAVELVLNEASANSFFKSVINYAYLHNMTRLAIKLFTTELKEFPHCLFSCHALKCLSILVYKSSVYGTCQIPESPWDFPALETLNLDNFRFGNGKDKRLNIFSTCVNLKNLALHRVRMTSLEIFHICAPQLSNLIIKDAAHFPKVFNVVAPQLQSLTASVDSIYGSCTFDILQLSMEGCDLLEKVDLSMAAYTKEIFAPRLLNLFQKLHSAKFLILDGNIIKTLSSCLDRLSHEPCPFKNLKCLKINAILFRNTVGIAAIKKIPVPVRSYLLENSPNATFIIDYPEELAKLEAEERERRLATVNKATLICFCIVVVCLTSLVTLVTLIFIVGRSQAV